MLAYLSHVSVVEKIADAIQDDKLNLLSSEEEEKLVEMVVFLGKFRLVTRLLSEVDP